MSRVININDTLTTYPSGYSSANSSYSSISGSYPVTNGYTDATSTTYAYITCNTGSRATTYISYTFDVSEIPANATIDSVTCSAKVRVSSTSYISTAVVQLYNGTTAKGSSTSARSTTATTYNLTPGSWTRSELNNIQIRYTGTRGTSNTTRAAYLYFYGATLNISYSINGYAYTIVATSNVDEAEIAPASQEVMEGEDAIVTIYANSLNDLIVTDNDVDITSQLGTGQAIDKSGSISAVPGGDVTTGFSASGTAFYQSSSTSSDAWLRYAIGYSAESPYSTSNTSNTYAKPEGQTAWMNYPFDFSEIPAGATITSVQVKVYGARENSTIDSSHVAKIGLYSGSTLKSTEQEFTSTSNGIITISDPGTWTREELQDAQLRFAVGYYGGRILGATWTVSYTVDTPFNYYWEYELNNISADHVILIDQSGPFIPPEEDPQKTYYPITISSINATTNPRNGTTRIEAGTTETITITPTDPQLTLALDNGVDITSQLAGGAPTNIYTVTEQVSGADYGFELNGNGYYESTNQGQASSASVCRVNFSLESDCLITFNYIVYTASSEANYDYCQFGAVDVALSTDNTRDSGVYHDGYGESSTSVQTLTYELDAGSHFIDIKYRKDYSYDEGNDSLQWKIVSIEATSTGGDYTYTLTNINQKHNLIFVFGNVNFYYLTSSGNACKLYPDGQIVKLEGDSYSLTIVPNDPNATVSITDNNVNRTSLLQYEEGQDKYGNTVVNYIYELSNITATHNLVVTCTSSGVTTKIFFKNNGTWAAYTKVYQKVNGTWVQQDSSAWSRLFDSTKNYKINN